MCCGLEGVLYVVLFLCFLLQGRQKWISQKDSDTRLWDFFICCKLKYFSAVEACTLKFLFSCLRSCYFACLTLLWCCRGIWLGACQSSDSIYDQQIRLCLLLWHNNNIHPCQAWSEFKYQPYCFFKHAVFIQKVRWAMSLCAYVMMKRALVEDVDAAPFGWVPKLLDDTDYSLYCVRLFCIVSRPHWAVVLVEKMLKTWD